MNIQLVAVKIKQRLNKLDSRDYDNLECWHIVEAFNKAQRDWCRRQLHGLNALREGGEQTKRRVDDLQILLKDASLRGSNKDIYFETEELPADYFEFNRISAKASSPYCRDKRMKVDLMEEGNVDEWLTDWALKPSFEWGETFATLKSNRAHVFHNNEFRLSEVTLTYYRQPQDVAFAGCELIDGTVPTVDVDPEFKDDIVELLIDEAASILAGDIESWNQHQRNSQNTEKNN